MFTQLKNIDTAFKHIKRFSICFLVGNVLVSGFAVYHCCLLLREQGQRVYLLYNGKVLQAVASDRKSNLPVELRDHIKTFHEYFFNLSPDDKAIQATIGKALYLADESAKKQYDNLKESGYYNNMISANISQEIHIDSTRLDIDSYPYLFRCFATETLVRASSTVIRKLVSQGQVRDLKVKTAENPHGFLIQNWEVLSNTDVKLKP